MTDKRAASQSDSEMCAKSARIEEETLADAGKTETAPKAPGRMSTVGRPRFPKRKVAIMLGYRGSAYQGMQICSNAHTIEGELFRALCAAGLVSAENAVDVKKNAWMRAARTDKGVHAAGQLVACKILIKTRSVIAECSTAPGDASGDESGAAQPESNTDADGACSITPEEEQEALKSAVGEINAHLPEDIRVFAVRRVTNGFHAKNDCDSRFYEYLMPTYALRPVDPTPYVSPVPRPIPDRVFSKSGGVSESKPENAADVRSERNSSKSGDASQSEDEGCDSEKDAEDAANPYKFVITEEERAEAHAYRVETALLERARSLLKHYVGSHFFHNFTIGMNARDPSARRFIIAASIGEPFIAGGLEWVAVRIHGQSFMLHQIRKMVSLVAMSVRLGCSERIMADALSKSASVINIPKAPALGLFLDYAVFDTLGRRSRCGPDRANIAFEDGGAVAEARRELKRDLIYPAIYAEEAAHARFLGWLRFNDVHASAFAFLGRYVPDQ